MQVEELLKPRYKVIADYPMSVLKIGLILTKPDRGGLDKTIYYQCEKHPHLFKKLEWWENREIKDMPAYIRADKRTIYTASYRNGVETENGLQPMRIDFGGYDYQVIGVVMCFIEPATEEEYNTYISNQKQ